MLVDFLHFGWLYKARVIPISPFLPVSSPTSSRNFLVPRVQNSESEAKLSYAASPAIASPTTLIVEDIVILVKESMIFKLVECILLGHYTN